MPAPKGNQYAVGNKGGRPTEYNSEKTPKLAFKLTLLGATLQEIADAFGVNINTIYNWQNEHEEFLEAIKEGKLIADGEVAHSLYQRALLGDTTAAIFWLKNRKSDLWRDRHQLELINPKEKLAEILGCSVEELPGDNSESLEDNFVAINSGDKLDE